MSKLSRRYSKWHQLAEQIWYKDPFIGVALMPLGFIFADIAALRKWLYRIGILKQHKLPVPVIVVGNITVGGTGKTPLVIYLAKLLTEAGYRPGIISRGYGGNAKIWPQAVDAFSDAAVVGDEAVLIAKQTGCPMAVGPKRVEAAQWLLANRSCDVILSDDGLQHYALMRDIECAVVDGERRFGNGYCLPAGPLREPISRLQTVDVVIVNGKKSEDNEISMLLLGDTAVNMVTNKNKPLAAFANMECHALAGIGNPGRFFKLLSDIGLICQTHPFPDHYRYQHSDIRFNDKLPVLMTEKDAVKCLGLAGEQHWYVPVKAVLEPGFDTQLLNLLKRKQHDR